MSGEVSTSRPPGVSTVIRMPSSDDAYSTARTRAPAPRPNVSTDRSRPRTIAAADASSPFTTAVRAGFGDAARSSKSRRFARR